MKKNLKNFEKDQRIFELEGEFREIAGEEKARILVRGKYYPALISTRSFRDEIAFQIGKKADPHIHRYKFHEQTNYNLFICNDGISNVIKTQLFGCIIENNNLCNYIFVN